MIIIYKIRKEEYRYTSLCECTVEVPGCEGVNQKIFILQGKSPSFFFPSHRG